MHLKQISEAQLQLSSVDYPLPYDFLSFFEKKIDYFARWGIEKEQ